jgi:hypothetical protein
VRIFAPRRSDAANTPASLRSCLQRDETFTVCRLATSGAKGVNALLRKFIASPPLLICHMRIYVKGEVENYLEKSFYDLSTLNLNDCNTYNRMRIIATERYCLHLTDPFLPDGSLDHGVDFVGIVRDLNCEYGILNDIPNRLED